MKKSLYCILILCSAAANSQITNGLVTKIPFTYGSVYDEVGTNHGFNVGATPIADRFGMENMAYYFNGSSYIYFYDNAITNLDNLNELSISVWIKPDNASGSYKSIISKWNGSTNEQYALYQNGLSGVFAVRTFNNLGYSAGLPIDPSGWYHVVFTLNKTTTEQKLYVNNVLLATYTPGGTYANTTQSTYLSVGAQYNDVNGAGAAPNRFFEGVIDDIQIFDRVLSVAEVDTLFNAYQPACEGFEVAVVQTTNTASNTGSVTFNVNGGHAPYLYSFESGTPTSMNSGFVCSETGEGMLATLSAPAPATFRAINFASYGSPTGTCQNYLYSNCHLVETGAAVADSLLGNTSGDFLGANSTFGTDPCFGTGKNLRMMASYAEDVTITNLTPGTYDIAIFDSLGCINQISITINDLAVGLAESETNSLRIYPNPATDQLTILTEKSTTIRISNVLGETVFAQVVSKNELLDISKLTPGLYFITTQNGEAIRLVKQ